jgi:hypothetical protein
MATQTNKDATETTKTTSYTYLDNSQVKQTVTKTLPLVVESNAVVADSTLINPGVITKNQ